MNVNCGVWIANALRKSAGLCVIVLVTATISVANEQGAKEDSSALHIGEAAQWTTKLGETLRAHIRASEQVMTKPPEQPQAIVDLGTQVNKTQGPDLGNALIYYRAIYACLASDERAFIAEVRKAKEADVFQPDLLLYEATFFATGKDKFPQRKACWEEYGRIVPISQYGVDRANRLAPAGKIDPPLPSVPKLADLADRLSKIGEMYASASYYDVALDSWIESIYANPWQTNASTWLTVGKIEKQLGQPELAVQAYLKAAFSNPALADQARDGIAEAIKTNNTKRKDKTDKKLSAKTAAEIAELYRQCNLHPLALHVLAEAQNEPGDALLEQKEAIEKEWLNIVVKYQQVLGDDCMILGVRVKNVQSWADVKILRPSDTFWKHSESSPGDGGNRGPGYSGGYSGGIPGTPYITIDNV